MSPYVLIFKPTDSSHPGMRRLSLVACCCAAECGLQCLTAGSTSRSLTSLVGPTVSGAQSELWKLSQASPGGKTSGKRLLTGPPFA